MESLKISNDGTKLAYLDSGVPTNGEAISPFLPYTEWYSQQVRVSSSYRRPRLITSRTAIFEKLLPLAPQTGLRVVAINRRDYPGSSTIPASEVTTMQSGTDDEKTALVNKRGVEIATFIDRFTVRNGILPISADGKAGGFSIVEIGRAHV